ncbi:MAG: alpha/beta fold hydrolase [Pirellulales bacterium]
MMRLTAATVIVVLLSGGVGFAQDPAGPMNLMLGFSIEDELKVNDERTKVVFPPRNESLLGAIVAFRSDGTLEIVRRLPDSVFSSSVERRGGAVDENLTITADSSVVSKLVDVEAAADQTVRLGVKAEDLELVRAVSVQEDDFKKALEDLEPFLAENASRQLYLATAVVRGHARATLAWSDTSPGKVTSKLETFQLTQPNPWEAVVVLQSKQPVEVACKLDLLAYTGQKPIGNRVTKVVKPAAELPATAWERIEPLFGAAKQFDKMQILFATNRGDSRVTTPDAPPKPASFWIHIVDYVMLMGFWIGITGGLCLLWLLVALFLLHLRSVLFTVGPLIACLIFWGSVILWYAYQESRKAAQAPSGFTAGAGSVMTYGTCDVSIPHDHEVGQLETPFTKLLIQIERENPEEHVVFLKRSTSDSWNEFVELVKDRAANSPEEEVLVFIHGFNNSFEEAAKRTAQFAYDLRFPGAPILFSWPSQGTVAQYQADSNEAERSQPHFQEFLKNLLSDSKAKRVHLVAHSMGNRILARTLVELAKDGGAGRPRVPDSRNRSRGPRHRRRRLQRPTRAEVRQAHPARHVVRLGQRRSARRLAFGTSQQQTPSRRCRRRHRRVRRLGKRGRLAARHEPRYARLFRRISERHLGPPRRHYERLTAAPARARRTAVGRAEVLRDSEVAGVGVRIHCTP